MKIRVGYGLGVRTTLNDDGFAQVVDALEQLRFDSLWVSERIGGEAPDPLVAMSFAAGRTKKLKFGMSVMVLPGRNPVILAKELATLDRLSNGRLCPPSDWAWPTLTNSKPLVSLAKNALKDSMKPLK